MLPDPVCQLLAISDSQTTLAVPAQSWGAGTSPGGAGLVWGDSVRLRWLSWERCWKFAHLHPVLSMPGWLLSPKKGLPKDPRPGHKGELVSSGLQRQGRVGEPPQSSRDAESEPPPALAAQPALLQPVLQFSSPLLCPFPPWAQTHELFLLLCSRFTPLSTQAATWVPGTWQAPAVWRLPLDTKPCTRKGNVLLPSILPAPPLCPGD